MHATRIPGRGSSARWDFVDERRMQFSSRLESRRGLAGAPGAFGFSRAFYIGILEIFLAEFSRRDSTSTGVLSSLVLRESKSREWSTIHCPPCREISKPEPFNVFILHRCRGLIYTLTKYKHRLFTRESMNPGYNDASVSISRILLHK